MSKNMVNGPDVPMGLGMALAMNLPAMNYFSGLSHESQQQIIERTHNIQSKEEMQSFVESFTSWN